MGRKHEFVLVLDADGTFVEYVEPAVARRALKERAVKVATTEPFVIQLHKGQSRVPRLFKGRGVPRMALDKFSKLFSEEQPLYVKTLVPGQVSFEIQVAPGMSEPVRVPHTGDPVCLTDIAPFDALKRCMDLRKLASPRKTRSGGLKPPAIQLLTEAEVMEHYERKAVRRGWMTEDGKPDIERATQPAYTEEATRAPANRVELPKSKTEELMEQGSGNANLGKDGMITIAEVVHPRILHICQMLGADAPENQRMSADHVLNELEGLGELNTESLNHLMAFGYYKSVKTWATQELANRVDAEEDDAGAE